MTREPRHIRQVGLGALLLLAFLAVRIAALPVEDSFMQHVRFLSSDELKGRGNDQPELDIAAAYIADSFRRSGLMPVGDHQSYFHEFEARTQVSLGAGNSVTVESRRGTSVLRLGLDYVPLFSGPLAIASGKLAFAGFGISAPELGYDDYREFDVQGKVVAVFQHEPGEYHQNGQLALESASLYSSVAYKAMNARARGAAAMVLLPDPHCPKDRGWKPEIAVESFGIPVIKVSEAWGRKLLSLINAGTRHEIDRAMARHSLEPFDLPGIEITISVDVVEEYRTLKNVVGLIPGRSDEYVILGAHYDHIGLGERRSLARDRVGEIHNGADDNASGTAGLLCLASALSGQTHDRGILFIAFAGEELGLLGSSSYVLHPSLPLNDAQAMINMDMIGRSDGTLFIGGVGTAVEFRSILDSLSGASDLNFRYAETPQAASDHLAFSGEKIPVLFFFSGLHADYHKPSDDWEKIDARRSRRILEVIAGLTLRLISSVNRVHFVDMDSDSALLGGAIGHSLLGFTTGSSWEADGVRISSVKIDTPAFEAGFQEGDVIVGCDGREVRTRLDLIQFITEREASRVHTIAVIRGDSLVALRLSLPVSSPSLN